VGVLIVVGVVGCSQARPGSLLGLVGKRQRVLAFIVVTKTTLGYITQAQPEFGGNRRKTFIYIKNNILLYKW